MLRCLFVVGHLFHTGEQERQKGKIEGVACSSLQNWLDLGKQAFHSELELAALTAGGEELMDVLANLSIHAIRITFSWKELFTRQQEMLTIKLNRVAFDFMQFFKHFRLLSLSNKMRIEQRERSLMYYV